MFGKAQHPAPPAPDCAGRLLLAAQVAKPSELKQWLAFLAQLAALTDAVPRLRGTQQRAAQRRPPSGQPA